LRANRLSDLHWVLAGKEIFGVLHAARIQSHHNMLE
jgi:hypothetical protein